MLLFKKTTCELLVSQQEFMSAQPTCHSKAFNIISKRKTSRLINLMRLINSHCKLNNYYCKLLLDTTPKVSLQLKDWL